MSFENIQFQVGLGAGETRHDAVLQEIREARKEVRRIEEVLSRLETSVRAQPDLGTPLDIGNTGPGPRLNEDQLVPLFGWIVSLYESFYTICAFTLSDRRADEVTRQFANQLANVRGAVHHLIARNRARGKR